jgi:tungstate transport system substrate-binding protein
MGLTLQVAGERRAYVLSDIGTFLAFRDRIGLVVLSKPESALRNVYSVLQVNAERFPGTIRSANAMAFERFLVSQETQQRIARFGLERFDRSLFTPMFLEATSPDD